MNGNPTDPLEPFTIFFSTSFSEKYLRNCYIHHNIADAEKKSYQNCYSFISYIEHGQLYFNQVAVAPIQLKPILLYYGFIHLLKACILTVDPDYPSSTSVLAHGLSTRKKKKQQYEFLDDEVKIQRNGFFGHVARQMFHMKQQDGEKFSMSELLMQVPELNYYFSLYKKKPSFTEVKIDVSNVIVPTQVLDTYHMTKERLTQYIASCWNRPIVKSSIEKKQLFLQFDYSFSKNDCFPFRFDLENDRYMLSLYPNRQLQQFQDILIHYLLLYNLSMIARYETEWWADLIKTMPNHDYPFIKKLVAISERKIPFLIFEWLTKQDFK